MQAPTHEDYMLVTCKDMPAYGMYQQSSSKFIKGKHASMIKSQC